MSTTAASALAAERNERLSADRTLSTRLRDAFREPHPFARKPATLKAYPVQWSLYAKRQLRTLAVFVPLAVVVLGWPLGAAYIVNLSNQVYTSPARMVQEPEKSHKIARRAMLQEGPVNREAYGDV